MVNGMAHLRWVVTVGVAKNMLVASLTASNHLDFTKEP